MLGDVGSKNRLVWFTTATNINQTFRCVLASRFREKDESATALVLEREQLQLASRLTNYVAFAGQRTREGLEVGWPACARDVIEPGGASVDEALKATELCPELELNLEEGVLRLRRAVPGTRSPNAWLE